MIIFTDITTVGDGGCEVWLREHSREGGNGGDGAVWRQWW